MELPDATLPLSQRAPSSSSCSPTSTRYAVWRLSCSSDASAQLSRGAGLSMQARPRGVRSAGGWGAWSPVQPAREVVDDEGDRLVGRAALPVGGAVDERGFAVLPRQRAQEARV